MRAQFKKDILSWAEILLGLLMCSLAYNMFLIPNDVAPGGFTGIGQLVSSVTGWPVGAIAFALNVPLFLFSARSLGLRFGLRSIIASVGLSLAIDMLPIPAALPADDPNVLLLASLFGGVLGGCGFGLILRGGATTGGSDMLAKLINDRLPVISLGVVMFSVDALVIVASAFVFDVTKAMFALICTFVMSQLLDLIVDGLNPARAYFIISSSSDAIAGRVMDELSRGVTALSGRGLYSGDSKDVLLCVVSRFESVRLREIVAQTDPRAFMIATAVNEALGEGFRPHKVKK